MGLSSTTFIMCPLSEHIVQLQNNGQLRPQGHSTSPILVPIESPYATS